MPEKSSEMREVYQMVTQQSPPRPGGLERQFERQRRSLRNRRFGAVGVVAALLIGIGAVAMVTRSDRDSQPAIETATPTVPAMTLPPNEQDVAVVDLAGAPILGIEGLPADAYGLDLSPDGSTIAFTTGDGMDRTQIATIGVDGTGLQVLATDMPAEVPAWSPDGAAIAFVGTTEFQQDIYVMDANGSSVRQITTDPADDIYPRWSPDGSTIMYTNAGDQQAEDAQFSVTAEIWTVPSVGGVPTQLTSRRGPDGLADYSPNGEQVAYFRGGEVWVMRADGSDPTRLVTVGRGAFTPRWSPDGARIAYTNYDDSFRLDVPFGGKIRYDTPLVSVHVVNAATGHHHPVGDVGMATDRNTPVWWTDDALLIRRAGH